MKSIRKYYDDHSIIFLIDYLFGNERICAQKKFLSDIIPQEATSILIIGCGSGEVTSYIASHVAKKARIFGVDISPANIDMARTLFPHPRVSYVQADILQLSMAGVYDVIILPDVYEHIPLNMRPMLHETIKTKLSEQGHLFVTIPSPSHQNYLKELGTGLQIVDEIIRLEDLEVLAKDVGGDLSYYSWVSVGKHVNNYIHAAIERGGNTIRMKGRLDVSRLKRNEAKSIVSGYMSKWRTRFLRIYNATKMIQTLGWTTTRAVWVTKGKRPEISTTDDNASL